MIPKDLVTYQDKLYYVFKRMAQDKVKDGYVNDLKDLWMCDIVVKSRQQNNDDLLFLREIPEAEEVKSVI